MGYSSMCCAILCASFRAVIKLADIVAQVPLAYPYSYSTLNRYFKPLLTKQFPPKNPIWETEEFPTHMSHILLHINKLRMSRELKRF